MTDTVPIKLSLALVTRNRPESLNACLESLRQQSVQPFEIVVSDDSDAEHQLAVRQTAERWSCRYVAGPRRGLYANRNSAALACAGTHIRTVDDDHRFPADHLSACFDAISSDPKSIWTVGERGYVDGKEYAVSERANQLHPSGLGCAVRDPDDNWAIADGSTIYPVSVFTSGYRMVEWYGYGSSYLEFGAYLYRCGFKSRCLSGTIIDHYAGRETLDRGNHIDDIESQLFSSFCYNLYFRPDPVLALKYLLACIWQARANPKFVKSILRAYQRAKARWSAISGIAG